MKPLKLGEAPETFRWFKSKLHFSCQLFLCPVNSLAGCLPSPFSHTLPFSHHSPHRNPKKKPTLTIPVGYPRWTGSWFRSLIYNLSTSYTASEEKPRGVLPLGGHDPTDLGRLHRAPGAQFPPQRSAAGRLFVGLLGGWAEKKEG